jgi:hypothetical protein
LFEEREQAIDMGIQIEAADTVGGGEREFGMVGGIGNHFADGLSEAGRRGWIARRERSGQAGNEPLFNSSDGESGGGQARASGFGTDFCKRFRTLAWKDQDVRCLE